MIVKQAKCIYDQKYLYAAVTGDSQGWQKYKNIQNPLRNKRDMPRSSFTCNSMEVHEVHIKKESI